MEEKTMRQENKMGTMPVNKLLVTMALPMVISMLVQALYNIVDSIYVAQISENALTAVSMAFPIQNLMIAIASGTGVGMNAFLSRSLGEKKFEKANYYANNTVVLSIISCIAIMIFGVFGVRWFYSIQTDISEIIEYGVDYMVICCVVSFGCFGQITFERILQSTGKTIYTMYSQGIGAVINIVLDPVFIFGVDWLGIPAMGTAGAAIATVLGQIIAMLLAIFFNLKFNKEITLNLKKYRMRKNIVADIYKVGVPSIIMVSISSVMNFFMNIILMGLTETAVAVFGIYFKLQSIIFMPIFGINNGMIPIISYNYGAQKRSRIVKVYKLSLMYSAIIMLLGMLVVELFPAGLLRMFDASENMLDIGARALRIMVTPYVLASFCVISGGLFQSLNKGMLSMVMSLTRQLIVLIPSAFLLAKLGGLQLVWYSYPIAEIFSAAVAAYGVLRVRKTILNKLPAEDLAELPG